MAQEQASVTITLTDEVSEPLARIQESFDRLSATMRQLSNESRGAFQPQEEGARNLRQRFQDVKEAGEKFGGSVRGELLKVGQEMGKVATEATGMSKAFNVAAESVAKLGFAVRGLTAAGAIGGIGAIVFGINAIGKAAFDAFQKQETFRRQLGLSAEMGRLVSESWGRAAESIGESAAKGQQFIQSMVEQIEQIRTRQRGAPIIQDLLTGRGEGGIRLADELLRKVNSGVDTYTIALEHIRNLSKQNTDYQREWAAQHGVSLRFVQDIVKAQERYFKLLDSPEGRANLARLIESQKELAEAHERWVDQWIKFEPTWNRILSFGLDMTTKITDELVKWSQKPWFPEIPKSWEEWKDFLFGKIGTQQQPNVFRPGETLIPGHESDQWKRAQEATQGQDWTGMGRQHGGPVMGGRGYIVGEHGPELFAPSTGGAIASSGATTLALRDIENKETQQTVYQREMADTLKWMRQQMEKTGAGGAGSWGTGGGAPGTAGFGGGAGMGAAGGLPGMPGTQSAGPKYAPGGTSNAAQTPSGTGPAGIPGLPGGPSGPAVRGWGGAAGFGGGAGGGAAAGVPGLPGTPSGPAAVRPFGGGAGGGPDVAGVPGLPGSPSGPAVRGPGAGGGTASGPGGAIYNKLREAYQNSGLVGTVPPWGPQFGITTGSADEWARFATGVAKAESSFNPNLPGPKGDPGGSHGLFQYAHGQVPGGNAFDPDASIAAFVRDSKTSAQQGLRGSILGRRFSTLGSHPERTVAQLGKGYKLGPDGGDSTGGATTTHDDSGRWNYFQSKGLSPGQVPLTSIQTPFGKTRVASEAAEDFKGFFGDLGEMGAPIKSLTPGPVIRPKRGGTSRSSHSFGAALDIDDERHFSPAMRAWIKNNEPQFRALLAKHGMKWGQDIFVQGERDEPHIEWGGPGRKRAAENRPTDRAAVDRSLAQSRAQKIESEGKLNVHISHPPGSRVRANGRGSNALKDIRVAQTPQMNTTGSYGGDSSNQYSEE